MTGTYLFYLCITALAVIPLWLYSRISNDTPYLKGTKAVLVALSFLVLYIPLAIRDISVGVDYIRYRDVFNTLLSSGTAGEEHLQWLGAPFIALVNILGPLVLNNYIIFYGLICFLGMTFLYAAILRSKIPWLSLLLFISFCLYFQMFNQMRQIIAICLILYSIRFIQHRDGKKFALIMIVASSFHMSSLIFIPMYFLSHIKITAKSLAIYLAIAILLPVIYPFVINIAASTAYGATYFGSGYDQAFLLSVIQNLLVRITMILSCLLLMRKTLLKSPDSLVLYNLAIWCTIIQALALYSATFGRVTTIFFISYILLIPVIIYANFSKWRRTKYVFLVVCLSLAYQYVYYNAPTGAISAGYDKYSTFIQQRGLD